MIHIKDGTELNKTYLVLSSLVKYSNERIQIKVFQYYLCIRILFQIHILIKVFKYIF